MRNARSVSAADVASPMSDHIKSPHLRGPSLILFAVSEDHFLVRATTPSQKELRATVPDPDTWLGCVGRKETGGATRFDLRRPLHSSFLGQYTLQGYSPSTHGHECASHFLQSLLQELTGFRSASVIFYRFQDASLLPPPASAVVHGYFDCNFLQRRKRTQNPRVLSSKTPHQSPPQLVPRRQRLPPRLNSAHNTRIGIRPSSKPSPILRTGLDISHITLKKSEIAVLLRLELQSSMPNRTPSSSPSTSTSTSDTTSHPHSTRITTAAGRNLGTPE